MNEAGQINTFILEELAIEGYERVIEIKDKTSGLHTIIAMHSTARGPALGGARIYPYATREEALTDVLRLSKGMTYKSALIDNGVGGGKAVIIADPKKDKTPELLEAFGRAVEMLEGQYITAQDSGMNPEDLKIVRRSTRYVVGLTDENSSGNPSPYTAWGNYWSIRAVCEKLFGTPEVKGKTIAVQGLGNVGETLCEILYFNGAKLKVADIDSTRAARVAKRFGAEALDCAEILFTPCDILTPCALGAVLNEKTIPMLQTKGVCGSANNQLGTPDDMRRLEERGILYAPDFVVNSGGAINVTAELEPGGYEPTFASERIIDIKARLEQIFTIAEENNLSTQAAAEQLAEHRIDNNIGKRTTPTHFHH